MPVPSRPQPSRNNTGSLPVVDTASENLEARPGNPNTCKYSQNTQLHDTDQPRIEEGSRTIAQVRRGPRKNCGGGRDSTWVDGGREDGHDPTRPFSSITMWLVSSC
jgi:hypothetical protein